MIDVIYLAAGQGKRAKLGYPKQFARLGGKPIMVHGLEALHKIREVGQIIVTCSDFNAITETIAAYLPLDKFFFVQGGKTRQESVSNALPYVKSEYVLIAEAVRPFITPDFVRGVIENPGEFVTPVMLATSSVIEWGTGMIECRAREIPRSSVGEVQMPQKFQTELLRWAHEQAPPLDIRDVTDDAALVMKVLRRLKKSEDPVILPGIQENIKITSPLDLIIAEAIYNACYRDRE